MILGDCNVLAPRETSNCRSFVTPDSNPGVQSVPRLAGLVGQASCLSPNDGQDARPTEEGIASGWRARNANFGHSC